MSPVHLGGRCTDAGARRHGNRLQPGRSGFDSHRRLFDFNYKQATGETDAPAAHRPHAVKRGGGGLGVFRTMASKASVSSWKLNG